MAQRFEYHVETVRSSMVGDRMDSGAVEKLLNDRGRDGWQLKSLTATQVKGRIGPGGTEGLLAVFERPTEVAQPVVSGCVRDVDRVRGCRAYLSARL